MARLDGLPSRAVVSPVRLLAVTVFLIAVSGLLVYLVGMPVKMMYYGLYGRLRPMVSERDLLRQGKQVPGGAQALREMIEGEEADRRAGSLRADAVADADKGGGGGQHAGGGAAQQEQKQEEPLPEQKQEEPPPEKKEEEPPKQQEEAKPAEQPKQQEQQAEPRKEEGGAAGGAGERKHALTKEMVAGLAQDNTILVTWANYHYRDFVMNWVEHLQAVGCKAFIVGAMDDKLLEFLLEKKVPTFSMSSGLTLDDFGWGTPTFHKMGREKINLIYSFTKMGFDVLISDVDTVWLRDPIPYMKQYPEADILTSSDHLMATVKDEGLEKWPEAASAANIGIMLFRPKGHDLAAEWVEALEKDSNYWDQNAFNDLMRRGSTPLPDRADRLFSCYDKKLKCGILPVSIFCSGHTGYTQNMPDKLGLKPYVVHATFQFSGTPGKRHRMRERLWWNDGPEYFAADKGFLVYENDVPPAMLDAARTVERNYSLEATRPHFALVNHQLKQLKAAFALATITGRVVILPRLWCGMDRWWAPHDGTIPGSSLEIPYACPADHVLDLEAMSKSLPENEFGPGFGYREYSFLERPQAAELNKSTLVLTVCKDASEAGCADGSSGAAADKVKPQLDDQQLKSLLTQGAPAEAKVLRIAGGIDRLFRGFSDAAAKAKFKKRLDIYVSIWCCVNAHPGHIWYDMFWDDLPHMDRHNREIAGPTWEPRTGP